MQFLNSISTDKIFMTYILNLIVYTLTLVLLFTTVAFGATHSFRTMNGLARSGSTTFFKFTLLVSFLSLSGLPPFAGFFAKFFLFLALTTKTYLGFTMIFLFFNLFALYFYLQSTRHLAQSAVRKTFKTVVFINQVTAGGVAY